MLTSLGGVVATTEGVGVTDSLTSVIITAIGVVGSIVIAWITRGQKKDKAPDSAESKIIEHSGDRAITEMAVRNYIQKADEASQALEELRKSSSDASKRHFEEQLQNQVRESELKLQIYKKDEEIRDLREDLADRESEIEILKRQIRSLRRQSDL